ncbi:Histidinol-phosphatase [Carnobacterium maltaromaticum]|uniref:PHP domain-containing protein n=1 Tax=Carnobacterium maltaromaticum TaxID=2751 RepID=UPI00191BC177|nr:PHP domain-containing protein [Carnobacterium maltaromaticum]CAD5902355.1 Histidinol-phosphatase [Carnobacterium maltaromaticum]
MKKIDFHIHTISTVSDSVDFEFSFETLKEYVEVRKLDAIAITNHNTFDKDQFNSIASNLQISVFPGIEVDLCKGHILIISDNTVEKISELSTISSKLSTYIKDQNDSLTLEQFYSIFSENISEYLMIPHYEKKPALKESVITNLKQHNPITCGEVSSAKKFVQCINNNIKPTVPVWFSDSRMVPSLHKFSYQQTYLDISEITLSSIKYALNDKNKVYLSEIDGHQLFTIADNIQASTGLNIILGERSSGKTYTLNALKNDDEQIKYIKQFELVEKNPENSEESFKKKMAEDESIFSKKYLTQLDTIIEEISQIDNNSDTYRIDEYITSLLNNASNTERHDVFSKTKLFQETEFSLQSKDSLIKLIQSVENILGNTEYKLTIEQNITLSSLINLLRDLVKELRQIEQLNNLKSLSNDVIKKIQAELQLKTSIPKITDINFTEILSNQFKIKKFNTLIESIKVIQQVSSKNLYDFNIIATRKPFSGASDLKKISKTKSAFSSAYQQYTNGFLFLQELKKIDSIPAADYFKYFVNIEFQILNKHGFPVSGGERAEFNFLSKIEDSLQYEILLIDEPESSFDNIFLNNKINIQLKDISKKIPVFIATHNNTMGASIKPDYIIYTKKKVEEGAPVEFITYTGFPRDKYLLSRTGESIENLTVQLDCLEAGINTYEERRTNYETLKN